MDTYAHVPAAVQLRTAISILTNVAADRQWGAGEVVYLRPAGRLQIGGQPEVVDAATVYMAARGLVGALLDDLSTCTGRDVEEIVGPWLLALEMSQAVADVEVED